MQENNLEQLGRASIKFKVKPTKIILSLDSNRVLRVLQNLVTNAMEVLHGRTNAQVVVSAKRDGRHCVIKVSDNGPGIPMDIRANVFEPFVSRGKPNGTGLGLAIAKSVIEAHGGTIEFHTSRKGTEFLIRLPLE